MAEPLTPYDIGERAEPKLWQRDRAEVFQAMRHGGNADVGKVDFDDDEGITVVTVYVSRNLDGGHTVHAIPHVDHIRLRTDTEE